MDYASQGQRATRIHQTALNQRGTFIDCHLGIAHRLPPKAKES